MKGDSREVINPPPATMSTEAMDTEEGDAIAKMILDKDSNENRKKAEEISLCQGMGDGSY